MAFIIPGAAALGPAAVERIVKTIPLFDDFCHANDRTRNTISGHSKPMEQ
jgi:hypothetical protein